jgi:hypothetical protein
MFKKKDRAKIAIIETFNSQVSDILKLIKKYVPKNDDINHIKRLIKIANETNAIAVLEKCEDKFWENKDNILEKNVEFFKTNPYEQYLDDDEYKTLNIRIINLIRDTYDFIDDNDKNFLWSKLHIMLNCIINFKLHKGNHI